MRLSSVSIRDFRLVGHEPARLDLAPCGNTSIPLADNGGGKSTFLDAAAMMLGLFTSAFLRDSDKRPSQEDIHISPEGIRSEALLIEAVFTMPDGRRIEAARQSGGGAAGSRMLRREASGLCSAADSPDQILPVVAYYDVNRGMMRPARRRRMSPFSRRHAYSGALEPASDFPHFFNLLDYLDSEERRRSEALDIDKFRLPALEAVRSALRIVVGPSFSSPGVDERPLRLLLDEAIAEGNGRRLAFRQLSGGVRLLVAMTADIAARMAQANPAMRNPLLSPGIILIDEVDLHLHPGWQRTVLRRLAEAFPNVQFVVSTHSPVVVAGAAGQAQVVRLGKDGRPGPETTDAAMLDIDRLLLSPLFGLPSASAAVWDAPMARRDELLALPSLTPAEESELQEIDRLLSPLRQGLSGAELRTAMLLERIATRLGIDP